MIPFKASKPRGDGSKFGGMYLDGTTRSGDGVLKRHPIARGRDSDAPQRNGTCASSHEASQCAVPAKKAGIGIGVPQQSLRRKPQSPHMVCGFVVRASNFRRLGREGLGPAGFSQEVARYANPFELPPSIGVESGGCSKPQPLEADMAESARTRTSAQPPSHPAAAVPAPRTLHELHALSPSEKDQFAFEQLSTLFDDCKWHDPEHFALLHALTVLRVRLQHRAVTEGGAA